MDDEKNIKQELAETYLELCSGLKKLKAVSSHLVQLPVKKDTLQDAIRQIDRATEQIADELGYQASNDIIKEMARK